MSLNGLDDAVVTSAYTGALAEAGGWFLLKYVSRDAIDVLDRGTRGAAEARAALVRYEEKSPLYGFLLYRRRKVLVKYTPEGTSRLLLARVAVHFTAVAEKFTPHDITMTINSAEELSDAALASACSLHTAAPSSCSSSSSRPKLDEITEDAEEPVEPAEPIDPDDIPLARLLSAAASSKVSISGATDVDIPAPLKIRDSPPRAARELPPSELPLRRVQTAEEPRVRHSHETARAILEHDPPFEPSTADYRNSLRDYDDLFKHGPDPRLSSQTARPAMSDLYAEIYAQYNKPKVKLGPRPKVSLDGKRPQTSGPYGQTVSRPVSSLPAGMRVANRKPPEPKRPKSRESSAVPSFAFPAPPPMPSFPMPPSTPTMSDSPMSPMFPPKSPASVRSMTLPGQSHHSSRAHGNSLEKQRLMKALELRKKQLKARQATEETLSENSVDEKVVGKDVNTGHILTVGEPEPILAIQEEETPESASEEREIPQIPREHAENNYVLPMLDLEQSTHQTAGAPLAEEEKSDVPEVVAVELPPRLDEPLPSDTKAHPSIEDSGIAMTGSLLENDDHQSAAEASSPIAHTQGSSCTPSTRPSSLSEGDSAPSEQDSTKDACDQATLQQLEIPAESLKTGDEEPSTQSSPTVVPEIGTPVVSAEIALRQAIPQQEPLAPAPAPEDPLISANRSEPTDAVPPPSGWDDVRAQKRSKRESTVFTPTDASLQVNEVLGKREKRASLVLTVPKRRSQAENKENRGAMADHIQIQLNEGSEEYLSDDSFMEELKSATVQEAKPVSVSKSPVSPYFARKPSVSESERSTSGSRLGRLSPEQPSNNSSVRKISNGWPPPAMNREDKPIAKKVNVSSGISQRIKALAEKSSRESSLSFPSSRDGPAAAYNVKQTIEKPESVQVTARIVRDPQPLKPSLAMPTETTPLELQRSQITIDHQVSSQPSASIKSPVKPTPAKLEPTSPRPPSSSKDPISPNPRSSSESSWRTFGRRLSESKSGSVPPRSLSAHSSESTDEKREEKKEKKDSRTSKMFKRISTMSSMSRKSASKEDEAPSPLPSVREPPPPVQIGDLNVQFPDTLLWKRRWAEIDAAGNLVLSMSKPPNQQSKALTKRFHLTEFRTPYAPDQDQQELPNSVAFDFIDGRTMQCACETYMAQTQVLQLFREAHDAWMAYDQGS